MIITGYNPKTPQDLIESSKPPEKKSTFRPKGRTPGALYCNNPKLNLKHIRNLIRRFIGPKAFLGPIMEKAIENAYKIVISHHVKARHFSLGYTHRTRLGIDRDVACWIVLLSTVNLTAGNRTHKGQFKCFVHLTKLDEIATLLSISRGSRFLELYRNTDLLKVIYKKSKKNTDRKWCEIYISRKAFNLAGITNVELDGEIERKKKNDKTRLLKEGTPENEAARAIQKELERTFYKKEKENYQRKKQQNKAEKLNNLNQYQNKELKKKAFEILAQLSKEYPDKQVRELQDLLIKRHPQYAPAFDKPPPSI